MTDLDLIHLFNFYLGLMFLLSTCVRISQYRAILALVRAVPGRWPRLFDLIRQHGMVFLTWSTVWPALLAFALFAIQFTASRFIWPQARLPLGELTRSWTALLCIGTFGIAMVAFDVYSTFYVSPVDEKMMTGYFDQAEYWLRSWTAPVVRVFTLGYIDPRKMVSVEVRKALIEASKIINFTLWWIIVQTGLRIAFGLAVWVTWALAA